MKGHPRARLRLVTWRRRPYIRTALWSVRLWARVTHQCEAILPIFLRRHRFIARSAGEAALVSVAARGPAAAGEVSAV